MPRLLRLILIVVGLAILAAIAVLGGPSGCVDDPPLFLRGTHADCATEAQP